MNLSDSLKRKLKNYLVAMILMLIFLALSVIVLVLDSHQGYNIPEWLVVMSNAVVGAVVGAAVVNMAYQWVAEKDNEESLKLTILETLCPPEKNDEEEPLLYKLYKKTSIEKILRNCLNSYCANKELSDGFFSYIENCCKTVKRNESYVLKVYKNENNGNLHLYQSLKDTRIFLIGSGEKRSPMLKMYYVFKCGSNVGSGGGSLDAIMSDHTYFFREELSEPAFVDGLIEGYNAAAPADKTKFVLDYLKIGIEFFLDENAASGAKAEIGNYQVHLDCMENEHTGKIEYRGLSVCYVIPENYVRKDTYFYKDEGLISYTARIHTDFRIPDAQNSIYVLYTYPTMNAEFKLFVDVPGIRAKDIDYMTYISLSENRGANLSQMDGKMEVDINVFTFRTSRIIFPRSGFAFSWNCNNSVK